MNDYKELIAGLKPCPFCGKEMEMIETADKTCFGFFHKNEKLSFGTCPFSSGGFIHYTSRIEAIEAWNRRANDAADAIEQLIKERDAAVKDIAHSCRTCRYNNINIKKEPCLSCNKCWTGKEKSKWEWRGVQEVEK